MGGKARTQRPALSGGAVAGAGPSLVCLGCAQNVVGLPESFTEWIKRFLVIF